MIEACEDAWWRSMEELVPIFEKEGINLHVEPHPEDWCETLQPALDIIRTVNSKRVKFLYCAPHTFYFGDDTEAMLRESADVLAHVHVGDTFNHKASSGLRYILNPPGTQARVHQHLNIGQGEVPWDDFFGTLAEVGFDGIMTACVFAWEDKADAVEHLHAHRDAALHRQVLEVRSRHDRSNWSYRHGRDRARPYPPDQPGPGRGEGHGAFRRQPARARRR